MKLRTLPDEYHDQCRQWVESLGLDSTKIVRRSAGLWIDRSAGVYRHEFIWEQGQPKPAGLIALSEHPRIVGDHFLVRCERVLSEDELASVPRWPIGR